MKHAWMIVNKNGNPVVLRHYLPVYWLRKTAQHALEEHGLSNFGDRVVKIPMPKAPEE